MKKLIKRIRYPDAFIGIAAVSIVVILIYWSSVFSSSNPEQRVEQNGVVSNYEEIVFKSVQDWRVASGLPVYKVDEELCEVVDQRLDETMINWSHDGFKEAGSGLRYDIIGENLSKNFDDPNRVLIKWLNSPTHRENLEKDFEYTCLKCQDEYCVHWFGKINWR